MKNIKQAVPVRIVKSATGESVKVSLTQIASLLHSAEGLPKAKPEPSKKIEPEVQLIEVSPGVFDVVFTCSCGQKTTIRCESVEK